MHKKILTTAVMLLALSLFFPSMSLAGSGNYTYLSTETGTQVVHVHRHEHKIVNPQTQFNQDDLIFIMTKIKNVYNIDRFSFKYELYSTSNNTKRTEYSNTFYPNNQNWAEIISSWNAFDNLPDGNYEYKVYIKVDNGAYQHLDTKSFRVGYVYDHDPYDYDYDYCRYNYCGNDYPYYSSNYTYNYSWTKTGADIRQTGAYAYEIVSAKNNFHEDESVRVLTKLANIRNIDHFRIKHEVYLDNNRFYKRAESPVQYPRGHNWEYNYTKADFGKLPVGNHEIRIYISVNGGTYKYLGDESLSVSRRYYDYCDYSYNWSKTDTDIRFIGDYKYDLVHEKSVFYTDENVMALTKLSNIRGIDTFRVKQVLYKNGTSDYMTKESPVQTPHYNYWEYNYTKSDFGRLPAGKHKIKAYISINGGAYKYLGTTDIEVKNRYQQSYYQYPQAPYYYYDWTKTGTDYGYYPPYPYYYN